MNVQTKGNELITKLLNDWYQAMLQQQVLKATNLKQEIDEKIANITEDENLLFYHSLLDFRYKLLTDRLSITKDSFNKIESLSKPTNEITSYYYHFFKAEHALIFGNNNEARDHYEKAETLLQHITDELEKAEFNQKFAVFNHHTSKMLASIQYTNKAKEAFSKHAGYEIKIASCENTLGTACIFLKQFEQAEEHLNRAIDILQKHNEEKLILVVRHNLGLLYATQNLSTLAIRHLSEVTGKIPNHFKANFLQAREHYKLGETNIAQELIERGLKICSETGNEEYIYHFNILKALNEGLSINLVEEAVKKGICYFEKQGLWDYVEEYGELLAVEFRKLNNHEKVSDYFNTCYEAKHKLLSKGALK
ncbi:tetratricopeptide repeat protein [Bacillus sp. S10(2024)]|uniref:response regulator aspartate phosphatase n=1 Tax=Bacillus sp. S10(2024) TaxID=3162886 RepID=UPI003D1A4D2F